MTGSVRARATLAATGVVAVALALAGVVTVLLLRAELRGQASLEAELEARDVAARVAAGASDLDLSDDVPVRVLVAGRVVAQSEDLEAMTGLPEPDDEDASFATGTARVDGETGDYRFAAVPVRAADGRDAVVVAGVSLAAEREGARTVATALLAGLPPLLAVVAAVTWLVTRRALRPVEGIRAEMAAITASGDLARRVPVPRTRDEVRRLATTTNATLAALEEAVARQRAFVADASHELRSPIASLRTQVEVAQAHPALLDVDGLVEDVVRLQHLAADLLLLARLDAGDTTPAARVDLADLVREEGARPRPGPPVRVDVRAAPTVSGHAGRLTRAVGNLLDNAARHAESEILISLREQDGRAIIDVADDGPGIPPADRERVFERFVRLDDARSRDAGGAGLGLAISRDLVLASGGTLTTGAATEGGALLTITLPVAVP
ncbi:sensor histidine kinase [Actinomadura flavalba]|uniref:sensor histidine kinase n=1 Tax=Actinomadura flavalba TaxID=1120938 RepID=UPI00037F99D3|nr:HAMP domain-containing sensor histidine kinase [Actinomadura flavalba]